MKSRKDISPIEKINSAPDLQSDELRELINVVRFLAQRGDIATLSGEDTREHNRFQQVNVNYFSEFVVRDAKTGFFIKGVNADIANVEYDSMNYLHGILAQRQVGVRAVRHAYMVKPDSRPLPAISIIEPAPGEMLATIHSDEKKDANGRLVHVGYGPLYAQAMTDIKNCLDGVLTENVRQLLASDLNANNIFFGNNGIYTIIDQPHPAQNKAALRWLRAYS